jgi:hypothetical protein
MAMAGIITFKDTNTNNCEVVDGKSSGKEDAINNRVDIRLPSSARTVQHMNKLDNTFFV